MIPKNTCKICNKNVLFKRNWKGKQESREIISVKKWSSRTEFLKVAIPKIF